MNNCAASKEYSSSVSADTKRTDRLYNDSASRVLQSAGQCSDRWQPMANTTLTMESRSVSLPVYFDNEKDSVDLQRSLYLSMKVGQCKTGNMGSENRQYVLISESANFFSGNRSASMSKETSLVFETVKPIGSLRYGFPENKLLGGVGFLLTGSIVAATRLINE